MSARSTLARIKRKTSSARLKKSLRAKSVKTSVKRGRGQPRKWDRKIVMREVCKRIGDGELLVDVLKDLGVPTLTFYEIMESTEDYRKAYARARKSQSHAIAQRAMRVARGTDAVSLERKRGIKAAEQYWKKKDPKNWRKRVEKLSNGLIQRNRLELDASKWYTRITNPAEFGDKVDLTSGGDKLPAAPKTLIVKFEGAED